MNWWNKLFGRKPAVVKRTNKPSAKRLEIDARAAALNLFVVRERGAWCLTNGLEDKTFCPSLKEIEAALAAREVPHAS